MTLRIPLAAMLTVDAVGSHFDSMSLAELELCVEEDLPSKNHESWGFQALSSSRPIGSDAAAL